MIRIFILLITFSEALWSVDGDIVFQEEITANKINMWTIKRTFLLKYSDYSL